MKRFFTLLATTGVLIIAIALPAFAHNFTGSGDCEGWTLQLDGTWNATEIFVDGSSVGLAQTVTIPDSSDSTTRSFVVLWDKPNATDVTVTHTLERSGECTTTTTPTTIPEGSSTTSPSTIPTTTSSTQPSESTTTLTLPPASSTTAPTTGSTSSFPATTDPLPTTTVMAETPISLEVLPFTGPSDWMPLTFLAVTVSGLGGLMVWSARKQDA